MRRCVALAVVFLAAIAPSAAAKLNPAVDDCAKHSALTSSYTVLQLQNALSTMPADVKEYTNCYDLIQAQLFNQLGGKDGGGSASGSGGSFLPTPVIIVLVLLALGAATFGAIAWRRRSEPPGGD
jgi:hypothetical protein